ncbi:MAG TPA: glucose 1-dehydrogenase [Pyrinomonadaceae bacterium]|jgi:NAD(P)-dependent dehydrogenase (short-subunit alcohol dehydrogenase family)
MEELKEKTAIVTGATSGIGRAVAVKFAAAGARVAAIGRNRENLYALQNEIERTGGIVKTIRADVTDESDAQKIVETTVENFGQIDILINAAGIIGNGTIENTALNDWDEMMNVNLRSVFVLMQKTIPFLEKTKGNVVNVSSVAGLRSFPGVLAYCVSKAGIDQLTRCASLELAPKQIRVNAVNPGVVVTELHKRSGMNEENYAAFLEKSKQTHPLGRAGSPDEIADLILFLASEKAGWITGVTYSIDGGRANTAAR